MRLCLYSSWLTEEPIFQLFIGLCMLFFCFGFYAQDLARNPIPEQSDHLGQLPSENDRNRNALQSQKEQKEVVREFPGQSNTNKTESKESSNPQSEEQGKDGIDRGNNVYVWDKHPMYYEKPVK